MQTAMARGEEEDSDDKANASSRTRRLSSISSTNWDNGQLFIPSFLCYPVSDSLCVYT
jgi:hypothetical protein